MRFAAMTASSLHYAQPGETAAGMAFEYLYDMVMMSLVVGYED